MSGAFVMTQNFRDGFKQFQRDVGGDDAFRKYFLEVMKLLVETCYHWTATPTKGNMGARGGRKGGQATIAKDIYWMTSAVSQGYLDVLYQRFGAAPIPVTEFRKKDGTVYLIDNVVVNVDGSQDQIDRYHKDRRKSNGRVFTQGGSVDANIGRWKPRNKMLLTKQARDKYLKNAQDRVGKLKSGWIVALEKTGSNLPPGWVSKAGNLQGHSGFAPAGGFDDSLSTENWSGAMDAINKVSYFKDDGFMDRAHRHVENFMTKGGKPLEGFLARMIKRHTKVNT